MKQLENILIKETTKSGNLMEKINELEKQLKKEKNMKININRSFSEFEFKLNNEKKENENLNLKIKELNQIINKLQNQIEEEKNKNKNFLEKIKEIENNNQSSKENEFFKRSSTFDKQLVSLYQKIEELKEKLARYPFELLEGEKMISILFNSYDQTIICPIICKNNEIFSAVELKLYDIYPKYAEKELYFLVNGSKVNRNKSLEFNNIHDHDTIVVNEIEENFQK